MNPPDTTISLSRLLDILIALRIKDMRKRHNRVIFHEITAAAPSPEAITDSGAANYLPPRRQWKRIRKDERQGIPHESATRQAIKRVVIARAKAKTLGECDWGRSLLALLTMMNQVLQQPETYAFTKPPITPIPKGKKDKAADTETYRVTASCATIQDRVLSSILSRQLQNAVESEVPACCYSFRSNGKTLQDAVQDLEAYRLNHQQKRHYVAECDIRGFFDSVPHRSITASINQLLARKQSMLPTSVNLLLDRLMQSYNFPAYGLPEARRKLNAQGSMGVVKWFSDAERESIYADIPDSEIGIPQGNPVSPVYANAVLVQADEAVLATLGDDGFYARYCDDIIIVHPVKRTCAAALTAYLAELKRLQIPAHPPKTIKAYTAEFFGMKSKHPYLWGNPANQKTAIPWIQFVGYQIRFDGLTRIRKDSVNNQKAAIKRVIGQIQGWIRKGIREGSHPKVSGRSIYAKITSRVIRSGTGDRRSHTAISEPEPCWADAFPLIEKNRFTDAQMRQLDRAREIQFRCLRHWLKKNGYWEEDASQIQAERQKHPEHYHGAPFSYFGTISETTPRKQTRIQHYGV